jgi:hypothetical protein
MELVYAWLSIVRADELVIVLCIPRKHGSSFYFIIFVLSQYVFKFSFVYLCCSDRRCYSEGEGLMIWREFSSGDKLRL